MRRFYFFLGLVCGLIVGDLSIVNGQTKESIIVQTGAKTIPIDENFIIYFTVSASDLVPNFSFPEIPNFKKLGVSRSKSFTFQNGAYIQKLTYSQYYEAKAMGSFAIPAVDVQINQQAIRLESFTVNVNPSDQEATVPEELVLPESVTADKKKPFFLVSSNVSKPYVGQGFTLKMSFFVPVNNPIPLEFDRNDLQIPELIQRLRPKNCWEENFGLQNERVIQVQFKGEKYTEYRFFQASYFALDDQAIRIPALRFRVMQLGTLGTEKVRKPLFFTSAGLTIIPRKLPNHPLAGKVPVGNFELFETISKANAKTGDVLDFKLRVVGDGNSLLWESKEVESDYFLHFNLQSTERTVYPIFDKMFGNKTDIFRVIPKQPGTFVMEKYFRWIYFNVSSGQFDTLRSAQVLHVTGQPADLILNTSDEKGGIYADIEKRDSLAVRWNRWVNWRQFVNFALFILSGIIVFLYWKARK